MPGTIQVIDGRTVIQAGENTVEAARQAAAAVAAAEQAESLFEFRQSSNLYDPTAKQIGKYVNSTSGSIQSATDWEATGYIPVEPGESYTISWVGSKRVGAAFYAEEGDTVDISVSASSANPLTLVAPSGAGFLVVNVKSNTIPEPTNLMINKGATASPYEPYYEPYSVVTDEAGEPIVNQSLTRFGDTLAADWINRFEYGDFVGGTPSFRSNSPTVDLMQPALLRRGLSRGIQWRAGNDFARYASGGSLLGKYYFAAFVVASPDAANLDLDAGEMVYKESSGGALSVPAGRTVDNEVIIDGETRMVWETGYIDTDVPNLLVGSTVAPVVSGSRFASEFTLFLSDTAIDQQEALRQVNLAAKARKEARRYAFAGEGGDGPDGVLVLNGVDATGYVESIRSGHRIRNTFNPFPTKTLTTYPVQFNIESQFLDGVLVRSGSDDIAPDHVEGATVGANHGYSMGRCTATGHGKTVADEGQVLDNGGNQYVLVHVEGPNTLLIARRTANSAPPTGTFTRVSGGSNTSDITVTSVSTIQWYPPHNNYNLRVFVDGSEVNEQEGQWAYDNTVQFVETLDILARETVVEWWVANGGASAGIIPAGDPLYRMVMTYRFDRDGQLTISRPWVFMDDTDVADLMGLQVGRDSAPLAFRIPGAEPFTYDGETLDYGSGVDSGRTLAATGTPSIFFNDTNLQATGEYAHRMISQWADYAFVAGLLPIGDAAYDVRRSRTSAFALELRGNTGKQYFRVVDKGDFVSTTGENYFAVGFRHVLPREAGRPLVCPVRYSDARAILYVDWVDANGFDRFSIPTDLTGRTISVLDSRNASLVGGGLAAGSLTADVSAGGDHGYLVLELAA